MLKSCIQNWYFCKSDEKNSIVFEMFKYTKKSILQKHLKQVHLSIFIDLRAVIRRDRLRLVAHSMIQFPIILKQSQSLQLNVTVLYERMNVKFFTIYFFIQKCNKPADPPPTIMIIIIMKIDKNLQKDIANY